MHTEDRGTPHGQGVPSQDPALQPFGDSEMASLTRALDWSTTPLGPIERWPQSLRTVVDVLLTSRFSMWMAWGPELTFFYNDAYRRDTIGVKHPWALGKPFREVWPEIWLDLEPRIRSVLETGRATWDEALLLFLERSGYQEETYHTFSYSPLKDDDGSIAGLFCVVTEVTERVIGERRLALLRDLAARLAATTRESEVFAAVQQALAASADDLPFTATWLFEEGGAHARLACATGLPTAHPAAPARIEVAAADAPWPAGEILGGASRIVVDRLHERFEDLPTGAWDRAPESAVIVPIGQRGQETPAGFLVVGLNPYRLFDGAYQGFVELVAGQIASSLANARVYEHERRRAEALAEIDRAKTTFFSNVSHELRTPLTLLLGPLEDTLRQESIGAGAREHLSLAHRNALRLLKLVNSLLDFSRIEAGRLEAVYEPTDLAACTAELASSFRSACERAGIALTIDTPPLSEPVYVDRDLWEKVVLNLLSNAFKHTFVGGITVSVRARDGAAELIVADSGVGIPAAELPRIFDRFHRVPDARRRTHEGTGIGLALVQEIVRRHGGQIDVESREDEGTTFRVRLPFGTAHLPSEQVGDGVQRSRASTATGVSPYIEEALRWLPDAPAASDAAERTESEDGGPSAPPVAALPGPARILLVDDNADMRAYVARLLREEGWTVETAADGRAALRMLRAARPDLVLSDVMMPGMDGFALLRAVRADPTTASIPIILLSARAGEEARVEGAHAGADDYLVKPFSAQELVARVGAHLTLARERSRAVTAVATARDLLLRVFEQAPVGICVMRGPEYVFEMANAVYRHFLPPGRQIIGRPVREVVPEAVEQGFVALLDQVRTTGQPWVGRAVEIRYDRHDTGHAESAFLDILYHPLYELDGSISGIIAVVSEVTDEVRARKELEDARRDAEEARLAAESANRAKSEFLAVMSHELRTPLNAIGGYVDLMDMGIHGPVTDEQRHALSRISRSQRHLLGLINDVLNLARIEAGRVEYLIEAVPISEVLAELAPMIEPQIAAKGLRYSVALPDAPLEVRVDREKLSQILLNLLSNAVKFTAAGGDVDVRVEAGGDDRVLLHVCDTGVGIPGERLDAIFEPFVQVRVGPSRLNEGAGLGLTISRDLARGMGGELTARSSTGQGSIFTLSLPRA